MAVPDRERCRSRCLLEDTIPSDEITSESPARTRRGRGICYDFIRPPLRAL